VARGWQTRSVQPAHDNLLNKAAIAALLPIAVNRGIPMAQSSYGRSDTMSDLKDKASDQIKRAADTAEGVATRVADQGRQAAEGMQDVAGNLKGALDKSIKDQPMATLAVAAMVGFVLGAIWKT
jgi:ElaB/YqjD/DUF883 family membrane-anchored ribosome-binding protein